MLASPLAKLGQTCSAQAWVEISLVYILSKPSGFVRE